MKFTRIFALGAAVSLPLLATAAPATAADEATVSVLHGIPAGSGADFSASRCARPAAITSLNERKRKIQMTAASPRPNVSAAIAICWPTE